MTKKLMLVGTASSVGKSTLVAGLLRIFMEDGLRCAPFKAQNMSLHAGVTPDGLEMGSAQILQAEACKILPDVRMNPILLKPTRDESSQVVVLGKVFGNVSSANYMAMKKELEKPILEAFRDLSKSYELLVIEGAGSAAEINLRENDLVNMGLAKKVDAPVILVADIDKGGVFAAIYGTLMLLPKDEKDRVKGIIINKFRGNLSLLLPGIKEIEALVGVKVLGVVPYLTLNLPEEDSLMEQREGKLEEKDLTIGIMKLQKTANFTDFQPLYDQEDVAVKILLPGDSLEGLDLILLPGTKNTLEDLAMLKAHGMEEALRKAHKNGTFIGGICGGYQMMGERLKDPEHLESPLEEMKGFGLLPMETTLAEKKITLQRKGYSASLNSPVKGYELHRGKTVALHEHDPMFYLEKDDTWEEEGYFSLTEGLFGTYLHGLFDQGAFTRSFLNMLRERKGLKPLKGPFMDYGEKKEASLNLLAKTLRESLSMEEIYDILHE